MNLHVRGATAAISDVRVVSGMHDIGHLNG